MSTPVIALLSKGLARYRLDFTEHFAAALGDRARVIAAPLGDDLWEVDFPALKAAKGRVSHRDFPRTWAELDRWSPQLLGIMEYSAPMLRALFWARARDVPVVVFTELGSGEPKQRDVPRLTRWRHALFSYLTTAQVALAPAARLPFAARHRPVHFAPHSIDISTFQMPPPKPARDKATLLTVAQYVPRKGLDLMAAALAPLMSKHDFEWRIIGVQDPAWLQGVIRNTGLGDRAVIAGSKQGDALITEYHSADIFVLPSRFDTYGVVTQEAAACGLPLLISRYAGSAQTLVQDGRNGCVIDPLERDAFTRQLDRLMSERDRWSQMGRCSRALAERWSVDRVGAETADFVWNLLQTAPNACHHSAEPTPA